MQPIKSAWKAAFIHLTGSVFIALLAAALVFGLWYPSPYHQLAGGATLFLMVVGVDVICGPLLTLVVFKPTKPRKELILDIGLVILIQLAALGYGIYSVAQARPAFLAFEGNRFRVVSVANISANDWATAAPEFQHPGFSGPRLIGTRLAQVTDPNFKESVMLSMQGLHPSFRPQRWVSYESVLSAVKESAHPLERLKGKYPEHVKDMEKIISKASISWSDAVYLPVEAEKANPLDWIIVIDKNTGHPLGFIPVDGW